MKTITGRVWKFGDDITTDVIFPQFAFRMPEEEQSKHCFSIIRSKWSEQVKAGDIILGGKNFGSGSGRECTRVLKALKLSGLIADSINGLFFRNCIYFGFPAISCKGISEIFEEGDEAKIDLDSGKVTNVRTGKSLQGDAIPTELQKVIEVGGYVPMLKREGYLK